MADGHDHVGLLVGVVEGAMLLHVDMGGRVEGCVLYRVQLRSSRR